MKLYPWLVAGMTLAVLTAWPAGAAPIKVNVLKNNVNLRAKPVADAEVVGQVMANDVLNSKSMDNEWVEITPPTHVDFWVLGDYVKSGIIRSRQNVNVRSGPGINFAIVGKLASGAAVTLRGARHDWVKIAPPETCSLWVSRSLVQVVVDAPAKPESVKPEPVKVEPPKAEPAKVIPIKHPEKKTVVKPPAPKSVPAERRLVSVSLHSSAGRPAAEKVASAPDAQEKPSADVKPPADLKLVPSVGQGQWKQYDGILRPRGVFARTPSRYRLVTYDQKGSSKTVCYVKGNNDQLSTLINRPMIISGREYWVRKLTYPVLIPDRIVLK